MNLFICRCGCPIFMDPEDFIRLNLQKLSFECSSSASNVVRAINGKVPISHYIMGPPPAVEHFWDHENLDKHDNRRVNLRLANRSQNNTNRIAYGKSKMKGVKRHQGKWMARIVINKKEIYLGVFESKIEAGQAYDLAALKHYGQFSRTNFPKESYKHDGTNWALDKESKVGDI